MPKINKKSKNYNRVNQLHMRNSTETEMHSALKKFMDPELNIDNSTGNLIFVCPICLPDVASRSLIPWTYHEMLQEGHITTTRKQYLRHIHGHKPECTSCKLTFTTWSGYYDHIPQCTHLTERVRVNRATRAFRIVPYDNSRRRMPTQPFPCQDCKQTVYPESFRIPIPEPNGGFRFGESPTRWMAQGIHSKRYCKSHERSKIFKK